MSVVAAATARFRLFRELVQLEHTLFGLPFAGCALVFAARRGEVAAWRIALTILCFALARAAAMAWNRYVDRDVDALNPRTAKRPVPRGAVSPRMALVVALACAAGLVAVAPLLGTLPALLALPAIVVLFGYSHMKRFTWACHAGLGLAISGAPLGANIAMRGTVDPETAWLALAVGTWVAGFDLIYACQDEEFDRGHGLSSVPARFGRAFALGLSAALHAVTIAALALAGTTSQAGTIYFVGVGAATLLLVVEHAIVRPSDLSRVGAAFFTVNGVLAVLFFVGTLADLHWKGASP